MCGRAVVPRRAMSARAVRPPIRSAMVRPTLVIMAKQPRMGQVKTRLGRDVGAVRATAFYRTNLATLLARLGSDRRWDTVLAVTPDTRIAGAGWPTPAGRIRRSPQRLGDLGQRMQRQLDRRFERRRCGPVLIVGTDIPSIRPTHIAAAFAALGKRQAVFGPSPDGGFWLVGQRRRPRLLKLFDDVRWSSAETLADCLRHIGAADVALTSMLPDIDSGAELAAVSSWFGRLVLPHNVGRT